MKTVEYNGGGTSIVGLLGVVFVAFKLLDVIDWSWWYVTMPFWGGLVVVLAVIVVALVGFGFFKILERIAK